MTFDYVCAILETQLTPPTGQQLHVDKGWDHALYPFAHEGKILTIDRDIWSSAQIRQPVANDEISVILWPPDSEISEAITRKVEMGACTLLAFSESDIAPKFDPDISSEPLTSVPLTAMPLSHVPVNVQEKFEANFIDSGFEVADFIATSAVCNIGYTLRVATVLRNRQMAITEHGLLQKEEDARRLAKFASAYAPEHAPFYPMKIFRLLYPQA